MTLRHTIDGISATLRIESKGRLPQEVAIRHYQLDYFILEGNGHEFSHNEVVTAYFNFILDGRVHFVRLIGQIKVDRLYGVRLVYEQSSILREVGRRMHSARRYSRPCNHLASHSHQRATMSVAG